MNRFAWKEFRENLWVLVITLLIPLAMLLYARLFLKMGAAGLGAMAGILTMFENVIFGIWGAMRMPPERATGWLTLRTLPVRVWQVWVLKYVSGIGWAFLCSAFIWGLAMVEPRDAGEAFFIVIYKVASGFALSYTISFTASLFLSGAASGVLGVLGGTVGWALLLFLMSAVGTAGVGNANSAHAAMLAIAAALGLLDLAVMAAQARGVDSRRVGTAFAVSCLVMLAIVVGPTVARRAEHQTRVEFLLHTQSNLVPRQGTGRYVYNTVTFPRLARKDGKESKPTGTKLWVWSIDGKMSASLQDRSARLTPLAWTSDGQVIYLSRGVGSERMWLMLWNPESGDTRALSESLAVADEVSQYADTGNLAVEPGGSRVAFVRITAGRLNFGRYRDLWVMDLRTGEERLLRPSIGDNRVLWRAGRIYLQSGDLKAIDPDKGTTERVQSLPPASEEVAG